MNLCMGRPKPRLQAFLFLESRSRSVSLFSGCFSRSRALILLYGNIFARTVLTAPDWPHERVTGSPVSLHSFSSPFTALFLACFIRVVMANRRNMFRIRRFVSVSGRPRGFVPRDKSPHSTSTMLRLHYIALPRSGIPVAKQIGFHTLGSNVAFPGMVQADATTSARENGRASR